MSDVTRVLSMKAYIFSVICALWFIYITLPHLKSMPYSIAILFAVIEGLISGFFGVGLDRFIDDWVMKK